MINPLASQLGEIQGRVAELEMSVFQKVKDGKSSRDPSFYKNVSIQDVESRLPIETAKIGGGPKQRPVSMFEPGEHKKDQDETQSPIKANPFKLSLKDAGSQAKSSVA